MALRGYLMSSNPCLVSKELKSRDLLNKLQRGHNQRADGGGVESLVECDATD